MKVLLIDDTLSLLEEIKDILLMEGYDVTTATDGYDGLQKISKANPDIIITDLVMPDMNGYQLIEKIKSIDKFKDVPIIVLSAQAAKEDKEKAFELHADKYLTKPCAASDLVDAIEEITTNE